MSKSYNKNNMYHAYLRDWFETISLLTMYTNYDGTYEFDEVMEIKASKEWSDIVKALGSKYQLFHYYVECDLNRLNAPLANVDSTIKIVKETVSKFNVLLDAILSNEDLKALFGDIDAEKVASVVDAYNALMQLKQDSEDFTDMPSTYLASESENEEDDEDYEDEYVEYEDDDVEEDYKNEGPEYEVHEEDDIDIDALREAAGAIDGDVELKVITNDTNDTEE